MSKTVLLLGSTSEQKISLLKEAISKQLNPVVFSYEVDSGITDQPIDEITTIQGSINRARNAIVSHKTSKYDYSVGMEGGLVDMGGLYHLVCAVSFINKDGDIFTGLSKKLPLPKLVSDKVKKGEQFGIEIRKYEKEVLSSDSAQIKLVEDLINRRSSFKEAIQDAFSKFINN